MAARQSIADPSPPRHGHKTSPADPFPQQESSSYTYVTLVLEGVGTTLACYLVQ